MSSSWPPRLARLLGRRPDAEVAKRAGVVAQTVSRERRRRGIPPFEPRRPRIEWTRAMLALLGTDTDGNVAAELRVHVGSVQLRRRVLHIPPFGRGGGPRSQFRWTARALNLLGKASDTDVGRRLGIHASSVWFKRKELEVPSFRPWPARVRWSARMIALLGQQGDLEVARRFRISPQSVRLKREHLRIAAYRSARPIARTPALRAALKLPNRALRERYQMSAFVITKLRREYGVPAPGRHPHRWVKAMVARLGKETDSSLAREMGLSPSAVHMKRESLGIPRFSRARRWKASELRLLGRLSDAELGRRLGIAGAAVGVKRRSLGVSRASR